MIEFAIPLKLVSEANAHTHWRTRQKRAREQRREAYMHATLRRAGKLPWTYPITITITRIAPRQLDSDNLVGSAKHVRDGVADALGCDDRSKSLIWKVEQEKGPARTYAVRIRIDSDE